MAFHPLAPTLLGLALALPFNASAEPLSPSSKGHADITDPAVFVPTMRYRSVFADTPTGVEKDTVDWKKANADVGEFRNGFVDILKWESAQEALKNPTASPSVPPTSPASPTARPAHQH